MNTPPAVLHKEAESELSRKVSLGFRVRSIDAAPVPLPDDIISQGALWKISLSTEGETTLLTKDGKRASRTKGDYIADPSPCYALLVIGLS